MRTRDHSPFANPSNGLLLTNRYFRYDISEATAVILKIVTIEKGRSRGPLPSCLCIYLFACRAGAWPKINLHISWFLLHACWSNGFTYYYLRIRKILFRSERIWMIPIWSESFFPISFFFLCKILTIIIFTIHSFLYHKRVDHLKQITWITQLFLFIGQSYIISRDISHGRRNFFSRSFFYEISKSINFFCFV